MTDEELDRLAEKLADLKLSPQKTKEKPRKKGLFSKVVVTLCILIVSSTCNFLCIVDHHTGYL